MTFAYTGIILCLIVAIAAWRREKVLINPLTVFGFLWMIILLFSIFHFYTMELPKSSTYLAILGGILSFIVGYVVNSNMIRSISIHIGRRKLKFFCAEYTIRYNLLYILIFICCVLYGLNFISVIRSVGNLNLGAIQGALQADSVQFHSFPLRSLLTMFILWPVSFSAPAIVASDFWFGKRDRKLLCLTVVMMILRLFSTANRTSIILFFVYFIVAAWLKMLGKAYDVYRYIKSSI